MCYPGSSVDAGVFDEADNAGEGFNPGRVRRDALLTADRRDILG